MGAHFLTKLPIITILEKHNLCTNKFEGYTQPIFSALSKSVQL